MTKTELITILAVIVTVSLFAFVATDSDGATVTEDGAVYELIEGGGESTMLKFQLTTEPRLLSL